MPIRRLIFLAVLLGPLFLIAAPSPGHAQTIFGLSTPPLDTAEAQRVRIWFPRESSGSCRVTVDIVDDSGVVVRHLANFLASPGYYNFYWDKRDDSGRRVPAGIYRYQLDNCGQKQSRPIEARYSKWEKSVDFSPYDTASPGDLTLTVSADSVPISVGLFSQAGRPLESLLVDSVFNRGSYPIKVEPQQAGRKYGNFQIRITVGDYVYIREVTFLP